MWLMHILCASFMALKSWTSWYSSECGFLTGGIGVLNWLAFLRQPKANKSFNVWSSPFLASNLTGCRFHFTHLVPGFNWIVTSFASCDLAGMPAICVERSHPIFYFYGYLFLSGSFWSCNINIYAPRAFSSGLCTWIWPFSQVIFAFNLLNSLPNNGIGHLDMYRNFIKLFPIPNLNGWKNGFISFFPMASAIVVLCLLKAYLHPGCSSIRYSTFSPPNLLWPGVLLGILWTTQMPFSLNPNWG